MRRDREEPVFLGAEVDAESVMQITTEMDDLLQQLNDYKVSKENLERKVLEQEFIAKAMTEYLKQEGKDVLITGRDSIATENQ